MSELTVDQKKLLYLISLKGRIREDNGNIIWLKELALITLVFEGISRRIFKQYDYAPTLVSFRGVKLYANVSQEYMIDIDYLIKSQLVSKLKMNTKYYDNITAYAITHNANSVLSEIPESRRKSINEFMKCPKCDDIIKVLMKGRKAYIICPECSYKMETGLFNIENIPYHSVAYFSGGGR
jgi:hypothetical protein